MKTINLIQLLSLIIYVFGTGIGLGILVSGDIIIGLQTLIIGFFGMIIHSLSMEVKK